jgi:hypothetical protein
VYLANRGIWDFGTWAGPIVGIPSTPEDIDVYLAVWGDLISEILS